MEKNAFNRQDKDIVKNNEINSQFKESPSNLKDLETNFSGNIEQLNNQINNQNKSLESVFKTLKTLEENFSQKTEEINELKDIVKQQVKIINNQEEEIRNIKITLYDYQNSVYASKEGKSISNNCIETERTKESKSGLISIDQMFFVINQKEIKLWLESNSMMATENELNSSFSEQNKYYSNIRDLYKRIYYGYTQLTKTVYNTIEEWESFTKDQLNFSPIKLKNFKEIANNTSNATLDSLFCIFKSSEACFVIWGTNDYNLEGQNLIDNKRVFSIKAHTKDINCVKHYIDPRDKSDLVLSSSDDRSVKVWLFNKNTLKMLIHIANCHSNYILSCSLVFNMNNSSISQYIVTSAFNDSLKLWGPSNYNEAITTTKEQLTTNFITEFTEANSNQTFILNANNSDVCAFNLNELLLLKRFKEEEEEVSHHCSVFCKEIKNETILFESDSKGVIRIWQFNIQLLLKKIISQTANFRGISLWDNQFLLASDSNQPYAIRIFDIKEGKEVAQLNGNTESINSIKPIEITKYGKFLISQSIDGSLKLWVNEEKIDEYKKSFGNQSKQIIGMNNSIKQIKNK